MSDERAAAGAPSRESTATGLDAVRLASELLHRIRLAHPTAGLWEAADIQWWWRSPRESDGLAKSFWFDDTGPVAAVLLTRWRHAWGLDPIVAPGAPSWLLGTGLDRTLTGIHELGLTPVEVLVRDDDPTLPALLAQRGFVPGSEQGATFWMAAGERPEAPSLPDGFRLVDRRQAGDEPHWLVTRNGADVEARLRQTTLYDPALDVAIRAPSGEIAAYGVFWYDPVTHVGLVEPMRTEDAHQRRGLARAVLVSGFERLAARGATRFKVSAVSEGASALYQGVGFQRESSDRTFRLDATTLT
jgi:predicted N-acetyltransferase YhbS